MCLLCVFYNRVFFSGNQSYPNVVLPNSLDDPEYVSDLNYYNKGLDLAKFKNLYLEIPSQVNTTMFCNVPTIDSQYGKIYINSHSMIYFSLVIEIRRNKWRNDF